MEIKAKGSYKLQEMVTTMDPVASHWSAVFSDLVGRVPNVLQKYCLL